MKTCITCQHSTITKPRDCYRPPGRLDLVEGYKISGSNCYFQRQNWPRVLGIDTCGKEAVYWLERQSLGRNGPGGSRSQLGNKPPSSRN